MEKPLIAKIQYYYDMLNLIIMDLEHLCVSGALSMREEEQAEFKLKVYAEQIEEFEELFKEIIFKQSLE